MSDWNDRRFVKFDPERHSFGQVSDATRGFTSDLLVEVFKGSVEWDKYDHQLTIVLTPRYPTPFYDAA